MSDAVLKMDRVAESVEGVIYAEAQRGLALLPVLLNELRARTGILLALVTATTSVLGGIVVNRGQELGTLGVLALLAFAVAVVSCLGILWPRHEWTFAERAGTLVANYEQPRRDGSAWTVESVQRDLALHMDKQAANGLAKMKDLQWLFVVAAGSLVVEIVCWLIRFAS